MERGCVSPHLSMEAFLELHKAYSACFAYTPCPLIEWARIHPIYHGIYAIPSQLPWRAPTSEKTNSMGDGISTRGLQKI